MEVTVKVEGIKELEAKYRGWPPALKAGLAKAGRKYAPVLMDVQGVRKYPPTGAGNMPPTPYYVRGQGTQYANFNAGNSEQYGSRFTVESRDTSTIISNTASYAKWIAGYTSQALAMARIGWKKYITAAKETQDKMVQIYKTEVDNVLKQLRLK